jgi:hypothetical protein
MTIPTTNVLHVDIDGIKTRRDADLATSRVLTASCSEAERDYYLGEIELKRRNIQRLRAGRRVPI